MAMTKDELLALIEQAAAEGWTELDLSGQELTELPEEIGKLLQLERLILGKAKKDNRGNQQWDFQYINGDQKPVALVDGNQLTRLPKNISHLKNLRYLDLSGNRWESLSDGIGYLAQLETLIALTCGLTEIPDSLAQLTSLQILNLGCNQISEISDSLARECIDFCVSAFFLWGKAFWKQNSKMREGCAPIFNGSVPFLSNIVHG
ncbi:MAG: leucine-rich repeat domain-containing protein, partial [Leptolyngbyaceae cyanobacterium]